VDQNGVLRSEKVGPKGLAGDLYRKRKTEVKEGRYFPPTRKQVVLFDEIARDFLGYSKDHKKSSDNDEARMKRLLESFSGKRVQDITSQHVEAVRASLWQRWPVGGQCKPAPGAVEDDFQPSDEN